MLLGDAAHGMLPHHGQGANTTIEDSITVAELLPARLQDFEEAMQRYQLLRRARTRIIQRSSRATNAVLHLPDDAVAGRDARLARFAERFGWIHEFDAYKDVTSRATSALTDRRKAWSLSRPDPPHGATWRASEWDTRQRLED